MVTGLNWTTYQQQLGLLAVAAGMPGQPTDPNVLAILPTCVDYAELRIYQDLDLLTTVSALSGFSLVANTPTFQVPQGTFVTTQGINVITPVGQANPNFGKRNSLVPTTKEILQILYPDSSSAGLPSMMAPLDDRTYWLGPWPNANYSLEILGTVRPASLSATNNTTFISLYLPHIFLLASMVYMSAFQRNWGKQSDDPQMAVSYEAQYQLARKSSEIEEARRKLQASGWTAFSPPVAATPMR